MKETMHKIDDFLTDHSFALGIILLGLIVGILHFSPVSFARVQGLSMMPNYFNGEMLLYSKDIEGNTISPGLVIFVDEPEYGKLIKRVVATAGDVVTIDDGKLYVNGAQIKGYDDLEDESQTWTLADDELFVIGDNTDASIDSRTFGPVKYENVRGIFYKQKSMN